MRRHDRVSSFVAVSVLLVSAAMTGAQTPAKAAVPSYRARVLGVFDELSGQPIEGVRVLDVLTGMSALTTKTGTVSLIFLPEGGSLVRLVKIGYQTQTLPMSISASDSTPVTLIMRRVAELAAVVTEADSAPQYLSPFLRGFEERRKRETGYYIDEKMLRANDGRPLGNLLLAHAPGVQLTQGAGSALFLLKSPHCMAGGPPQVFLDGVPLSPDIRPDAPRQRASASLAKVPPKATPLSSTNDVAFNLADFDVGMLAGVEWYPDSDLLPIEFSHTSARCGALLLWTREK